MYPACQKGSRERSQQHRVSSSQSDAGHDGEDDALGEILEARLHLRVAEQPPSVKVIDLTGDVFLAVDCLF